MIIEAGRHGTDEGTDAPSDGTAGEEPPAAVDWIDVDRLVWDPEYRQRIKSLLKYDEMP